MSKISQKSWFQGEIFKFNTDEVFIQARDITLIMLKKFGYEVIGEAKDFYGEPVTPIKLTKHSFFILIEDETTKIKLSFNYYILL